MKGYVANTDYDWYRFLASCQDLDEVNFWQPSGGRTLRTIEGGSLFFFRLKSPHNSICGFGVYWKQTRLPAWLAWESFGEANGAPSFETMRRGIERYRHGKGDTEQGQYEIGCLLIEQPVFFERDAWIPQPSDWRPQIMQGKTYDLTSGEGKRVLDACRERAGAEWLPGVAAQPGAAAEGARYGTEQLIRPRLGQGTFRVMVLDAYRGSCAVTSEHSLPVLEAAHIRPYAEGGAHEVPNGILLRSDLHRLFDKGYVTVASDELRFNVSPRLREEWENGREYYALQGARIHVPRMAGEHPDLRALAWHNERVFLT
jgi:putative restriction endonuclease